MQELNREKLENLLERRVRDDLSDGRVGGCDLLVRQHGALVYRRQFGEQIPGEGEPLREDALYRLASMTKPVTAACVLIQAGKGKLTLDDPLTKYLPAYGNMTVCKAEGDRLLPLAPAKRPATLRDLLTHSSGIGSGVPADRFAHTLPKSAFTDLQTVTEAYSNSPLPFQPGEGSAYSPTVGFDLLARVVELTSDMPYDTFIDTYLGQPLELTDTTFHPTDAQWKRMVGMHNRTKDGVSYTEHEMDGRIFGDHPLTYFCGGAGLASTMRDYDRFVQMLWRGGVTQAGERIIPEELVREMRTRQLPLSVLNGWQTWGLGVRVIHNPDYPRLPVGSFGWSGAYGTHFWIDPENDITAIYLKNCRYDGGSGATTAANFETDVQSALA